MEADKAFKSYRDRIDMIVVDCGPVESPDAKRKRMKEMIKDFTKWFDYYFPQYRKCHYLNKSRGKVSKRFNLKNLKPIK